MFVKFEMMKSLLSPKRPTVVLLERAGPAKPEGVRLILIELECRKFCSSRLSCLAFQYGRFVVRL